MSTYFTGEGNVGSDPEVKMFPPNGNQPPRGVMRLNVRFDNPVSTDSGFIDKGGFWANVELWGRDAEEWARLYQKGMRVMVSGRMVHEEWQDKEGNKRSQFKVQAARIGILPSRIAQVVLKTSQDTRPDQPCTPPNTPTTSYPKSAGQDGEWANSTGMDDPYYS